MKRIYNLIYFLLCEGNATNPNFGFAKRFSTNLTENRF